MCDTSDLNLVLQYSGSELKKFLYAHADRVVVTASNIMSVFLLDRMSLHVQSTQCSTTHWWWRILRGTELPRPHRPLGT